MSRGNPNALAGVLKAQAARRMRAEARLATARAALSAAEAARDALDFRLAALEPVREPGDAGRLATWQSELLARRVEAQAVCLRAQAPVAALRRELAVEQAREDAARELSDRLRHETRLRAERRAEMQSEAGGVDGASMLRGTGPHRG